jgi:DNA-binding CsgD family transcriptional regulator
MKCPDRSCKQEMTAMQSAFVCAGGDGFTGCGATVTLAEWADTNGRSTASKPTEAISQSRRSIIADRRSRAIVLEIRAERIHAMIDAGKPTAEIAAECGVSQRWVQTLYRAILAQGVA